MSRQSVPVVGVGQAGNVSVLVTSIPHHENIHNS